MKKFDIEGYLDGELSGTERAAFEREMRENSDFRQEVETYRQFADDLETQLLREQVTAALSSDAPPSGNSDSSNPPHFNWKYLLLLLLLPVFWFFFLKKEAPPIASEVQAPEIPIEFEEEPQSIQSKKIEPTLPDPIQEPEPPKTKKILPPPTKNTAPKSDSKPPVFADNKTALPRFEEPNIRGEQTDDQKSEFTVDSIWWSSFPPEGVQF